MDDVCAMGCNETIASAERALEERIDMIPGREANFQLYTPYFRDAMVYLAVMVFSI